VYEATYRDLLRFVQRRVHPTHAGDIAADVFLVAWPRFDDLPPDAGDARAWHFGIAQRTLLNAQRGDRRRQALTIRIADATVVAQSGKRGRGPTRRWLPELAGRSGCSLRGGAAA
jgi:RNA polymerase sigma-70 factor, ECF subfamily